MVVFLVPHILWGTVPQEELRELRALSQTVCFPHHHSPALSPPRLTI